MFLFLSQLHKKHNKNGGWKGFWLAKNSTDVQIVKVWQWYFTLRSKLWSLLLLHCEALITLSQNQVMQVTSDPVVLIIPSTAEHQTSCGPSYHFHASPWWETREGSDTWEYSFLHGYPMSGCPGGFELKRPGASVGATEHTVCDDLPWETTQVIKPLWPGSVGMAGVIVFAFLTYEFLRIYLYVFQHKLH